MRKNPQSIAVDIDDVLSETALCWMDIVNRKFGNNENLSAKELKKKYKITWSVPSWQNEEIHKFLENMRISNEFHENVKMIKGAAEYIKKIDKIIPIACYLTVRPKILFESTRRWLKKNNFLDKEIIMKPSEISTKDGNEWKAKTLNVMYPDVMGLVDDNPKVIDFLPPSYKGTIFLYGFNEYKSDKIKVLPCKNWPKIIEEIKKEINK